MINLQECFAAITKLTNLQEKFAYELSVMYDAEQLTVTSLVEVTVCCSLCYWFSLILLNQERLIWQNMMALLF